ncbi:hypothetical protein B0I33_11232 [Prauserella shujinwangii]|uniref:Uncharacterized protein n=1 Tax=Prauserella shujinwangii TaxID=1453103 RepID=A0A2T0LM51_9PSEU|nr:hypothetical protein [Prauserella shujinwangii]PRX44155.1 hypothetical protein B0I33_11232 [Prauserella shujinwangii]
MPIRTHRGRAAVYRRLWGWPLRSPTHLAGALVLLVALVVAAGILVPRVFGEPAGAGTGDGRSPGTGDRPGYSDYVADPADGGSRLPTRLSEPLESPTSAPPEPAALRVAEQWATAWVNHPKGISNEQWLENLRPLTTEEYLPRMESVNPANIPATRVTGEPEVTSSFTSSVDVTIPTDGPALSLTVVRTNAGWRVAQYDAAE